MWVATYIALDTNFKYHLSYTIVDLIGNIENVIYPTSQAPNVMIRYAMSLEHPTQPNEIYQGLVSDKKSTHQQQAICVWNSY